MQVELAVTGSEVWAGPAEIVGGDEEPADVRSFWAPLRAAGEPDDRA